MVPDLMPHEVRNVLSQKLSKVNFKRFTLRSSFLISSSIRQQVVQLRFNRVPALYREAIWDSINELQLRSLWFYQCKNIDVMRLSTCFQLEVLELTLGCTILPTSPPATLKPDQFLPLLEILHIFGTCLGKWSRLFETHRPVLTKVSLNCTHFGITPISRFTWSDLPLLWPNLTKWNLLSHVKDLPIDQLPQLIDQWKSLNEVYLQIPKSLPTPREKEQLINNPRAYLDRNGRLSSVTATLHEVDDDEYGQCLYN